MENLINIKNFILCKYTEIKVPEKVLDVILGNETQVNFLIGYMYTIFQ